MRGAKGGFWDRLICRIRKRKIEKKKIIELEEEINTLKQNKIYKKKKQESQALYIFNVNKTFKVKLKKQKFRINKKGIGCNKAVISKNQKNEPLKVIISTKEQNLKKNNINNITFKEEKISSSPKHEKKKVSSISNKRISKKNTKGLIKKTGIDIEQQKKVEDNSIKLIEELNKIISNNKGMIDEIKSILEKLNNDIKEAKTTKKVEEIEQKIIILKELLNKLAETYENIKYGSFSKLGVEKIDKLIEDIKKIEPNFNFDVVLDKVKPNLDYYNDMSERTIEATNMVYSTTSKKDIISYKDNKLEKMKIELKDFEKINSRLSKELSKHNNIVNEFNKLIKKISPEKIVHVQNNFLSTMLHNTGCLIGTFLSIPFLKKPKNVPLFTFGLFTINNSIRSMRKVTTTKKISYVPSDDYTNQIIKYKNSFGFVEYMISDTLYQISEFKEEYKSNFAGYHDTDIFDKNLKSIEKMENKILIQTKKIKQLKKNYEKTLDNNYQKVLSIKNNK